MQICHLAVDIGASSGRHIVGMAKNGRIELHEVYRFENGISRKNGHLCWDLETLFQNVLAGIRACRAAGYTPATIGIDTWAVDFVLLDAHGKMLGDAVAYRDERTAGQRAALEKTLPFAELYARTGIQYQPFNTIYQMLALRQEHPEQLAAAQHFLMVPDYLNYRLTGVMANEYTNATTTALVNARSKTWDAELIARLGLPDRLFGALHMPGETLGGFTPEIERQVGFACRVLLPATHDTGSAFLAVPARDENAVYLSSGTWSLLGVENPTPITTLESRDANFTNEGGYQFRFRYLKNIMGLWMIQSIRRELADAGGRKPDFSELIAAARAAEGYPGRVNPDAPRFLAPRSMMGEIRAACKEAGYPEPASPGEVLQCVYNSLAEDYAQTVRTLQSLTGKTYTSLNLVGGGSQDAYLNQKTADATGLPVFAGPTEGTALGNLIVQFLAGGEFADLQAARRAIQTSFEIREVTPQ
jgi:rhamnulokinase